MKMKKVNPMQSKHKMLLCIDGVVNVLLGLLLLLFPYGVVRLLGLPETSTNFYPGILGAVILGIGFALFIELFGFSRNIRGLGLGGAIAINFTGALVLVGWLISGTLVMPLKGQVTLWVIGILVIAIGVAEMFTRSWDYNR